MLMIITKMFEAIMSQTKCPAITTRATKLLLQPYNLLLFKVSLTNNLHPSFLQYETQINAKHSKKFGFSTKKCKMIDE